ncbi:NAD(P)H-hydrate dehydratase [Stappia sp.]|uniref:NAD(P)H-hydrate dehydratase n=1 Tax=Stappia sp. TaxID=1870903 RepID=UPI003A9A074F
MIELLTPTEMGEADRLTIAGGVLGLELMKTAGRAVADVACRMAGPGAAVLVLAGPGNNGGDGFVAARLLRQRGNRVRVLLYGDADRIGGDAALALADMETAGVAAEPATGAPPRDVLQAAALVIDALFGAGLDRPLSGAVREAVEAVNASGVPVLSVDLPSGVSGASGQVTGGEEEVAIRAARTVSFFRAKPGHLLMPGRTLSGKLEIADIGIAASVLSRIGGEGEGPPCLYRNAPALWSDAYRLPGAEGHKFTRGHAVVLSGPALATGAARLAAAAALRSGAGLVTVATPPSAALVNAAHLTAVMLRSVRDAAALAEFLGDPRVVSVLAGPGAGVGPATADSVRAMLDTVGARGGLVVLDADALTSFVEMPEQLFAAIKERRARVAMTPHAGEFARLFPDLAAASDLSKVEKARAAARRSGAVVVLKGADTVIAAPDRRAAINANAPAWLATAGSGDVLAGTIAGLGAQGMAAFEAAAMGVWLHGEAGRTCGVALTSEDLPAALKSAIETMLAETGGEGGRKQ